MTRSIICIFYSGTVIYVTIKTSYPVKCAAILMKLRGEKRSGHEVDFTDLIFGLLSIHNNQVLLLRCGHSLDRICRPECEIGGFCTSARRLQLNCTASMAP